MSFFKQTLKSMRTSNKKINKLDNIDYAALVKNRSIYASIKIRANEEYMNTELNIGK